MLAAAVDDLLARFRDRWPERTFPEPIVWVRALRGATAGHVAAAAVEAVTLDDAPPDPSTVARRIAAAVAAEAAAGAPGRMLPPTQQWRPDPAVLARIRDMKAAQAAAADRFRLDGPPPC